MTTETKHTVEPGRFCVATVDSGTYIYDDEGHPIARVLKDKLRINADLAEQMCKAMNTRATK